jgi:phosphoglycolate phosphatase-like HAD superfamily hydrolase
MSSKTQKPVLVLDFDGVICSSAREVLLTGLEAFLDLKPTSTLADALHRLSNAAQKSQEGFENDLLYRAFLPLIPLGNRAEDFGVALLALEAGIELEDQEHYDRFFQSQDQEWLGTYHRKFYEVRERSRIRDLELWLALHQPYGEFLSLLKRARGRSIYAIATAKDGASVRLLLNRFGIADLFPDELLLDKETAVKKRKHLREIAARTESKLSDITFVDDKVNHLESVSDLGVRPTLAAWGYNTKREHQRALDLGYDVVTLETAATALFGGEI